jgi:hypothetical protein
MGIESVGVLFSLYVGDVRAARALRGRGGAAVAALREYPQRAIPAPTGLYGPVRTPSTQQRPEISWTICRIPVPPFAVHIVKFGQLARPKTDIGEVMTQYLVAIYRPENYDPAVSEDERWVAK